MNDQVDVPALVAEVERLRDLLSGPVIVCDPRRGFGRACVAGTRLHAEVVAEHVWAGEGVDEVAADFEVGRDDVLWCCAWWVRDGYLPGRGGRHALWQRWADHALWVLGGHRKGVALCDPDDYTTEGL